jgi:hypothetical protein
VEGALDGPCWAGAAIYPGGKCKKLSDKKIKRSEQVNQVSGFAAIPCDVYPSG